MKILVLSSLAYSLVNFRGSLLRSMQEAGHEVVAVAPDKDPFVSQWLSQHKIRFSIVTLNRTGMKPLQDIRSLSEYVRLIVREKPDLILAYTQKPIIYGGIAARIAGNVPFYALMSGLGYLFSEDGAKPRLARSIFLALYREGVRRARKIFVFNRDDQTDMLNSGILNPRQNVIQVPGSGVDTNHFAYQPLPEGPLHFLMVGRLMRDKGVYEFLEAARRVRTEFPDTRFSILGRADNLSPTGIRESDVADLQAKYPVEFLPETTDVRPHLATSSVFVLPSYYREGLPRTILEAMATGRAVITTDMPGCREAIAHGKNGVLVPPRDVDALVLSMRSFIDNPDQAARMGRQSRDIAERDYEVTKVNAMLMEHLGINNAHSNARDKKAPHFLTANSLATEQS